MRGSDTHAKRDLLAFFQMAQPSQESHVERLMRKDVAEKWKANALRQTPMAAVGGQCGGGI